MGTFVIGFDLGKEYSQICCWNEKSKEPVSVAVEPGTEKYRIPKPIWHLTYLRHPAIK